MSPRKLIHADETLEAPAAGCTSGWDHVYGGSLRCYSKPWLVAIQGRKGRQPIWLSGVFYILSKTASGLPLSQAVGRLGLEVTVQSKSPILTLPVPAH